MNQLKKRAFISMLTLVITFSCVVISSAWDVLETNSEGFHKNLAAYANIVTDEDVNLAMQTSIPRMLTVVVDMPEYLGFTPEQVEGAVLGDRFTVSQIIDYRIEANAGLVYFPVIANDKVITFITLIKFDGDINATTGAYFVEGFNKCLEANTGGELVIVSYEGSNIFAVNENSETIPIHGDVHTPEELQNLLVVSEENAELSLFEQLNLDDNVINADSILEDTVLAQDVIDMYSYDVFKACEAFYAKKTPVSFDIIEAGYIDFAEFYTEDNAEIYVENSVDSNLSRASDSTSDTRAYNPNATALGDYLDNYQIVMQGSDPICWAGAVASMIRWERPSVYPNLTARQVCDAMGTGYEGASAKPTVVNALKHYLTSVYKPTYVNSALTQTQIRTAINNEDPAYMSSECVSHSKKGDHGTALCGYLNWSDGTFSIRVADPGYGIFVQSDRQYSSTVFRFPFGSLTYQWKETVRLLY